MKATPFFYPSFFSLYYWGVTFGYTFLLQWCLQGNVALDGNTSHLKGIRKIWMVPSRNITTLVHGLCVILQLSPIPLQWPSCNTKYNLCTRVVLFLR